MHIALISPLPPEQNGIADYADAFRRALEAEGVTVSTPLLGRRPEPDSADLHQCMAAVDWSGFDLVHGELGGGRTGEFQALEWLTRHSPDKPLTATVHDPERLIWKPARMPNWLRRWPRRLQQAAVLVADPLTLARERRLARRLALLVTLTHTGAKCLRERMGLEADRVSAIPHGNAVIPPLPLPTLPPQGPLRLLYFGFIYRGKGIEDLIDAVARLGSGHPGLASVLEVTLAGGTRPDLAFGREDHYLETLRDRWRRCGLGGIPLHWRLDLAPEQIPTLVQAHHVMVLPYRESGKLAWLGRMRGTSGALSWAAACGRSVVSSDARAFAEDVSHGNGAVFPQGDSRALSRELGHLLDHPECISERAGFAADLGSERSWACIAARFHELFRQRLAAVAAK